MELDGEDILPTYHEKVKVFRSPGRAPHSLAHWLEALQPNPQARRPEEVKKHLVGLVPGYRVPYGPHKISGGFFHRDSRRRTSSAAFLAAQLEAAACCGTRQVLRQL